ncbi:unnamed protein product, partial [Prunus brigantina]
MGVETLLNSGFLQVFLWERLKGLDVYSLPHSHAMKLADWGRGSFMPDNLPLVCRWFKRMQRKGQDFLKLLDNVENFVFRPYGTSAETFTFVPFYADVGDAVEVPAAVSQTSKTRAGGFSRGYQAYWNRCLTSFREFQSFPGDRLPPTTARLAGLVSEEKAIPLSQKRNLPFISKSGDIVGEFPKTKPKPGVQSPGGSGKIATPVSSKRKREEEKKVSEKQTASKPKRFIPKVAPSGPPRTKEATPP